VNPYSRPPSCLERVKSDGAALLGNAGFLGTERSTGLSPHAFRGDGVWRTGPTSRREPLFKNQSRRRPNLADMADAERVCSPVAVATQRCLTGRLAFLRHPSACRVDRRQESVSIGPPLLGLEGKDEQ
jgi:hypothetical protein